jgi:hypothetical protein
MLAFLHASGRARERKLRLFAAACCRRIWHLLTDERSHRAVEVAERFADGVDHPEERELLHARAWGVIADLDDLLGCGVAASPAWKPAMYAATAAMHAAGLAGDGHDPIGAAAGFAVLAAGHDGQANSAFAAVEGIEREVQGVVLRDILGNPFKPPPVIDPCWLQGNDGLIVKLALAVYEHRLLLSGELDPARLSVLADALLDAGCTDAELLGHLRSEGPHYRGCHVVDLLTGRE